MYIASRNLLSLPPPTILVPQSKVEAISRFIDALKVLDDSNLPHELVPFAPSSDDFYPLKNRNYKIKAFETVHPIASQGYLILSTKQKLKDKYLTLKGNEIKALKMDGVEITDAWMYRRLCLRAIRRWNFYTLLFPKKLFKKA